MSLISVIRNNPISFVETDDNFFATEKILKNSECSCCLYVVKDNCQLHLLTKTLKLKDSKIIKNDTDFSDLKKYNFIDYDQMKEYLIERKQKYDIFDQIFIPINETKNVDLFLIIKIINKLKKETKNISNICYILRNNSIEANYDLKLKKDNTYVFNNDFNVIVEYKETYKKGDKNVNFKIIEDIQNLNQENNKNILVILSNAKDVQHIYYHMLKTLNKKDYFVVSIYEANNRLNYYDRKDDNKTIIYIISSNLTMRFPLPNIGYIFDSFVYGENRLQYNSKDRANKYISYFSPSEYIDLEGEEDYYLFRYTSCEFFENTYAYDIPDIRLNSFYYNFLVLINNSYDPVSIFKNFIEPKMISKIFTVLNNLKLLSENKIIIDYKLLFSFKLYLRPSLLIMKAIENNEHIYPFIVLASIIHHSENGFFIKTNSSSGMLKTYLDAYIKYSKDFKTINPEMQDIIPWCEQEFINKNVFINILESIKKISNIVVHKHKLTLGLFDTQVLIQKAMPYLLEVYTGFIFKETDKHKHFYSNDTTVAKIYNTESDYPQNVISFKSSKPGYKQDEMDMINFYIGFNIE